MIKQSVVLGLRYQLILFHGFMIFVLADSQQQKAKNFMPRMPLKINIA